MALVVALAEKLRAPCDWAALLAPLVIHSFPGVDLFFFFTGKKKKEKKFFFFLFLKKTTQTPAERGCVVHRLGVLRLWSPLAPDGHYALDLATRLPRTARLELSSWRVSFQNVKEEPFV